MNMTSEVSLDTYAESGNPPTFIDFLLDETASMQSCANATRHGFDEFVTKQREEEGECFLTLTKFDSQGVKTPYEYLPLEMVPPLSFFPGASTNLYDCIGDRLTAILDTTQTGKSLFVIMTDGGDNMSHRYTIDTARDLVVRAQSMGIVVVFLGPSESALSVGTRLGIPEGNIKSFRTEDMHETMSNLTESTTAFRAGTTSARGFFA